jgi:hypothetical protein
MSAGLVVGACSGRFDWDKLTVGFQMRGVSSNEANHHVHFRFSGPVQQPDHISRSATAYDIHECWQLAQRPHNDIIIAGI